LEDIEGNNGNNRENVMESGEYMLLKAEILLDANK
jgi:hypothetical protein